MDAGLRRLWPIQLPPVEDCGPAAGLDALDAIASLVGDFALAGYHLLYSIRGDLLMKMGRFPEARTEVQRAIAMTENLRDQELLANKLKQIQKAASSAQQPLV